MADLTAGRIPKANGPTIIGDSAITDTGSGVVFDSAIRSGYDGVGVIPASQPTAGSATSNNYAGAGEVDFWNLVNNEDVSGQGFYFYQKTGLGTAKLIADFYSTSLLSAFDLTGPGGEVFTINLDAANGFFDVSSPGGFVFGNHLSFGPLGSLLQNKAVATPLTGTTVTMTTNQRYQAIAPAGTIAALILVLPPSPVDNQAVSAGSSQIVTALTVNAGTGAAARVGAPTTLAASSGFTMVYQASNNTWYRAG